MAIKVIIDTRSPAFHHGRRFRKMKQEQQEKLKEIPERWKDEEMHKEKQDVFDFMHENFGFLLDIASKVKT